MIIKVLFKTIGIALGERDLGLNLNTAKTSGDL